MSTVLQAVRIAPHNALYLTNTVKQVGTATAATTYSAAFLDPQQRPCQGLFARASLSPIYANPLQQRHLSLKRHASQGLTGNTCRRIHGSFLWCLTYPTLKRGATRCRSFAAHEHLLSASQRCTSMQQLTTKSLCETHLFRNNCLHTGFEQRRFFTTNKRDDDTSATNNISTDLDTLRDIKRCLMDPTPQWELAERIAGRSKAPEQALRAIFDGAIERIEQIAGTILPAPAKERVWSAISPYRLRILHDLLIIEVCNKILDSFSEQEINDLLDEHKGMGEIVSPIPCIQINLAFTLNKDSILRTIENEAIEMTQSWIPEMVASIEKESPNLKDKLKLQPKPA